jgi:hypothetical protein
MRLRSVLGFEAQHVGRALWAFNPPVLRGQNPENVTALDVAQRVAGRIAGQDGLERFERFRQLEGAPARDDRALQDVLQFPNVAGPRVSLELPEHLPRNVHDALAVARGQPLHEVPRQDRDIAPTMAERRNGDREDVQPEIPITAETTGPDFFVNVAVGGRNHARLDAHRPVSAQTLELTFLQKPQQLCLRLDRELADLVEEESAAVRQLHAPDLRCPRVGERAALVTEQLALEQCRRNRRAVHADELPEPIRTRAVNGLCDEGLAGTGFTEKQHRRRGGSDLFDPELQVLERVALSDERRA